MLEMKNLYANSTPANGVPNQPRSLQTKFKMPVSDHKSYKTAHIVWPTTASEIKLNHFFFLVGLNTDIKNTSHVYI